MSVTADILQCGSIAENLAPLDWKYGVYSSGEYEYGVCPTKYSLGLNITSCVTMNITGGHATTTLVNAAVSTSYTFTCSLTIPTAVLENGGQSRSTPKYGIWLGNLTLSANLCDTKSELISETVCADFWHEACGVPDAAALSHCAQHKGIVTRAMTYCINAEVTPDGDAALMRTSRSP